MKRFIRLVCFLLVFASLASIPAYAQENSARASDYLSAYGGYCTQTSSTSLIVSYQVIGTGSMDEIGANTVTVQYSPDQVNWTTAHTFYKSSYPSMTINNRAAYSVDLTCTVPAGMYYRAKITFYAAKTGGFAERYYTTDII